MAVTTVVLCILPVFITGSFAAVAVDTNTASGRTEQRLQYCLTREGLLDCVHYSGFGISLPDVFQALTSNVSNIDRFCMDESLHSCIMGCQLEFLASAHGYMRSVCLSRYYIMFGQNCWTETFVKEATECFNEFYPHKGVAEFYPTPSRVYDRHTIEKDCFPSASEAGDECPYYQSYILFSLMPQYYQYHGWPHDFDHRSADEGFPGF